MRRSGPSCHHGCACCCEPMAEPVDTSEVAGWPLMASWRALVLRLWRATARPDWHRHAACQGRDPRWWDGGRYGEWARAVCQQCPVSTECLTDVLNWETRSGTRADSAYGVAGGMTAPERRELYRALPESVGVASNGRRQRQTQRPM